MRRLLLCLALTLACAVTIPFAAIAGKKSKAPDDGYAMVLFPIKVIAHWGEGYVYKTEVLAVEGIANTVAEDPHLGLKYSYTTEGEAGLAMPLEEALGRRDVDVWRQTSLMSNYSPDWHRVKSFGAQLSADLAVLIRIREDAGSHVIIYLYDYQAGKIYSKTNKGVYYGSMSSGVQKVLEALMRDFYKNQ